jgi:hypothetical protein
MFNSGFSHRFSVDFRPTHQSLLGVLSQLILLCSLWYLFGPERWREAASGDGRVVREGMGRMKRVKQPTVRCL